MALYGREPHLCPATARSAASALGRRVRVFQATTINPLSQNRIQHDSDHHSDDNSVLGKNTQRWRHHLEHPGRREVDGGAQADAPRRMIILCDTIAAGACAVQPGAVQRLATRGDRP
jgi:hypothetical protein